MDGLSHPDPQQLAMYLDDACTPLERAAIESHGALCADCRAELIEAAQVLRSRPGVAGSRRQLYFVPLAAAAALLLLLLPQFRQPAAVVDREPGVLTAPAPVAATPNGDVSMLTDLTWTRVPGADAYQPTVFDSAGTVLWTVVVSDTTVAVPASLREATARNYYWTVRARTGWDRWVTSSLTRFRIVGGATAPQ